MGNNASAHAEALKAIKRLSPTRDGWQRVLANFNKDVEGSMSQATEDQRFLEVGDKKVLDSLYALINATLDKAPIPVTDVRAPRPPSARRSRPCPPRRGVPHLCSAARRSLRPACAPPRPCSPPRPL